MKYLLMVAFHFPPFAGSSGVQRTMRFAQHLPAFGWRPLILTAHPRAYSDTTDDLLESIPQELIVERAFALDAARHLSMGGAYPASLARPDRWASWRFDAIRRGKRLIRAYRPSAIWSTFPVATAHAIGNCLQRNSSLPWFADFRDPMVQDDYPSDLKVRHSWEKMEREIFRNARCCTFSTRGAARLYRERFGGSPSTTFEVIENGYDEESFDSLGFVVGKREPLREGCITLLHSGVVYPSERDPSRLFFALSRLKQSGALAAGEVCIRFRASNNEQQLSALAGAHSVEDLIEILPPISYRHALQEMLRADGLVILQARNCNDQIPAKLYEYLRARRPILGLTDIAGDTASAMLEAGISNIAALDSVDEIEQALIKFVTDIKNSCAPLPSPDVVRNCSRLMRTKQLADLLDRST